MDDKKLLALFESMGSKMELGDFNSFKSKISSDEKYRRAFFDTASVDHEIGDYDYFQSSFKKKDGTTISPSPSKSQSILAKTPDELPLGIPGMPNTKDLLFGQTSQAREKLNNTLDSRDDIYQRYIRDERLNLFDSQQKGTKTLDGFVNPAAQTVKRDIVKVIPVTQDEIFQKKEQVKQDPVAQKEIIRRAAKKDPDIAKSAYLVDAEERAVKDPTKANTIIDNANKIASGELTYDIKSGRLQKPEGILTSTYRGFEERGKQMNDYDFFTKTLNDDAIMSQLEADMKDYDPDRPMPVPEGAAASFGQMVGMEGIAMGKGVGAATLTAAIPGGQAAAPYVAAFAASPEYYKRGYATALRQAYYEQRQKGVPEREALDAARKQAESEANLSAAEGFASGLIGARIGMKPSSLKVGGGFKNAVGNVVTSTGNFIKENIPEGLADASVAGGLQVAKNIEAINNGLDRGLFDGVQENAAGELSFAIGLGVLTKAARFAVNPKSLNTIVTGIAQQPKEVVDAKLGEMVVNGMATPKEVVEAGKKIEEARAINSQIPAEITDEEQRAEISDRIKIREELKKELATANEVFHDDIKSKISGVDQEILNIVNTQRNAINESQEGRTEGNIVQPQGTQKGQREVGQGEGLQGQAAQQKADVGDSYISSEGQLISPELSKIERLTPEQIQVSNDATEFANQMQAAQSSLGRMGMSVSPYAQEDYDQIATEGGKFLRAADNKVLSLLKPNGEMVSLVKDASVKAKGAAQALITKMKDMGGLFMDNYDIYLTPIYEKAGYKVVARVPFNEEFAPEGWNAEDSPLKNKPDVVFMVRNDIAPQQEQTFADYDEAQNYTNGIINDAVASGKAQTPVQMDEVTAAIEEAIPNATKSLQSANIKFNVVDGVTQQGAQAARGNQAMFVSDDGTVIIDKSKIRNAVEAGLVVWHEASHPVMNIIRNTNKPLYDAVVRGLNNAAKSNEGVADALNWAQSQEQYDNADTQNDEAIVETIGRINAGLIDVSKLDTGLRQKLIDFVNSIAKFFGIDPILNDTDLDAFKKTVSEVADALKTGRDIGEVVGQENVKEYMNNLSSPEIVAAGQLTPQARPEGRKIDVYESKEVSNLPVRSMQDIYDQFGGRSVVINSDPTRVGELTLTSGKKIFMYGGPGYLSVKENVDSNVGFATTQLSKVAGWIKYTAEVFGTEGGVTMVATQAPTSMLSNSYALRSVMDAISKLPKGVLRSSEFKSEFFGNDLILLKDAFGEKSYNEFVAKYKKADLSKPDVIDGMISEMAYKVGDDNNPASFKARGAFVSNLLGGITEKASRKGTEDQKGYVSVAPKKFIAKQLFDRQGLNQEKLFYELGEKSLVDLYMNEGKWGMAVSGFESVEGLPQNIVDAYNDLAKDPDNKEKWQALDDAAKEYASKFQQGGVKHPLFNAKFPGKNAFILDGAYEVNKMFKPIEMTGPKGGSYTKTAAQMLAGSMYVKGKPTQTEGTFEYGTTQPSGNRIQASVGNRNLAPNGKPSNLNEKQYQQVRTPEFKAWFGDWENNPANASKVVDENGEPLVVYHGSGHVFDTFEQGIAGSFFAKSIKSAETYGVDGSIYPVFLSIKQPALINAKGEQWREVKVTLNSTTPSVYKKATLNTNEIVESLRGARFPAVLPDNDVSSPDGVVFKNIRDSVVGALPATDVYVSFKPNQIKSAIGNSGAFSTTDNRIQESVGNRSEDVLSGGARSGRIQPAPIKGGKPKSLSQIIFDAVSGTKQKTLYTKTPRALGSYTPSAKVVKVRYQGDLDTSAHEIGHAIDDEYGVMSEIEKNNAAVAELDQFSRFGSKPPKGHPDPARYVRGEGFAEFLRAYLVNPDEAMKSAPELSKILNNSLPDSVLKSLDQFSNDIRSWAGASASDQIAANVQIEPEKGQTLLQKLFLKNESGDFSVNWVDKIGRAFLDTLKVFDKAISHAKGLKGIDELAPSKDPMVLARLLNGFDAKFGDAMKNGLFDAKLNRVLSSNGDPMTIDWLVQPLADLDQDGKPIAIDQKELNERMKNVISYMIAERTVELADRFDRKSIISGIGAGIFTDLDVAKRAIAEIEAREDIDKIKEAVTRYREMADATLKYMVEKGRISVSEYDSEGNLVGGYEFIKRNNLQYAAMQRVFESEPGEVIDTKFGAGGRTLGSKADVLKTAKGSTRTIVNPYIPLLENVYKSYKESDRNEVMRLFRDLLVDSRMMGEDSPVRFSDIGVKVSGPGNGVVTIFVDGKPEYWKFQNDVYNAIKNLDSDGYKLPGALTALPRALRWSVTKFPVFALRNVIRDFQQRIILSGEGNPIKNIMSMYNSKTEHDNAAKAGALNAGHYMMDRTMYYGLMGEAVDRITKSGGIVITPDALKKGWDKYGQLLYKSENVNRIAEYKNAYDKARSKGMNDYDASLYAASKSRNLIDFAVAGHVMKIVNQLIPFSNAAVQGLRSSYNRASKDPAGFAGRLVLYSVLPQVALWMLNHRDEEDEKEYENLPDYQRDMFYNIKIGDNKWLSIPKPFELGLVASGIDRAMSYAKGFKKSLEGYAGSIAKAMFPFDDGSMGGPLQKAVEVKSNYDFFRDQNIIPPHETSLRVALRNTETASRLGKILGKISDSDPRMVDYFIRGQFSYFGNLATKLSDIGRDDSRFKFDVSDTGVMKKYSAYASKPVQNFLTYAKENGLTNSKLYKSIMLRSKSYFNEKDEAVRERKGRDLMKAAETVLDSWKRVGMDEYMERKMNND